MQLRRAAAQADRCAGLDVTASPIAGHDKFQGVYSGLAGINFTEQVDPIANPPPRRRSQSSTRTAQRVSRNTGVRRPMALANAVFASNPGLSLRADRPMRNRAQSVEHFRQRRLPLATTDFDGNPVEEVFARAKHAAPLAAAKVGVPKRLTLTTASSAIRQAAGSQRRPARTAGRAAVLCPAEVDAGRFKSRRPDLGCGRWGGPATGAINCSAAPLLSQRPT